MKLKNAVEKAKRQRGEVINRPVPITQINKKAEKRDEWSPPKYTESKNIELDIQNMIDNRFVSIQSGSKEGEYYKVLRTNLQHRMREKNWKTLMITSANPGEGKTLTSINLAISFSKEYDHTVLLIDSDMKKQSIHRYMGFKHQYGLKDYLIDNQSLEKLIVWPGIDKLTIISGGRTINDSAELLGSPKMRKLVQEIKHKYDDRYIIFDLPPVLYGADAITFAPLADCIILVVLEGKTSIKDVRKMLEFLPKEKIIGFVLNRVSTPTHGYYY